MYYECTECGQMAEMHGQPGDNFVDRCPVCEETTSWTRAFEGEGVSL